MRRSKPKAKSPIHFADYSIEEFESGGILDDDLLGCDGGYSPDGFKVYIGVLEAF